MQLLMISHDAICCLTTIVVFYQHGCIDGDYDVSVIVHILVEILCFSKTRGQNDLLTVKY